MCSIEHFFELCDRYCAASGITEATLSGRLFNDGKRIRVVRESESSDIGIKKIAAAVQQLSDSWPNGTTWPRHIRRPTKEG